MFKSQSQCILFAAVFAVCGVVGQNNYGIVGGDVGKDAPFLQSLSPTNGPKEGGTTITVEGAGFANDDRLTCRFQRLNPQTEMTVSKTTKATYVSPTQMTCPSPAWEEDACASCATATALLGTFTGHSGSPYLRSTSDTLDQEIGAGDYVKITAAQIGAVTRMSQIYKIKAIQKCTAASGCVCGGAWAEGSYSVTRTYNGSGTPGAAPNSGFEVITATDNNCAMYRYDEHTGGAQDGDSSIDSTTFHRAGGASCTPTCAGNAWQAGTKITLSEPVWKIPGTKNAMFQLKQGFRASKHACTSCKCAGGCTTTVSVTNDGHRFSGSGVSGEVWSGSGLKFSLKDIVPTVHYIDNGVPGFRDSTRQFGPAAGGTMLTIAGKDFQESPRLRCWFAGVKTMVKAEYVSDTKIMCKTPPFFSRQLDSAGNSNQAGSAASPHTKVQVTNTGQLGWSDLALGHLSQNPHLADDGSKSYTHTFDAANSYTSGASANPFRSTCQAGLYPNEGMKPCYDAHTVNSEGNDVLFKYATCYDAQAAGLVPSLDMYTGTTLGSKAINSTSTLGQPITLSAAAEGPLTYLKLHLEKTTDSGEAIIEVSVAAGNYASAATPGTIVAKETISVGKITATVDNAYNVFFNTPAYLRPGTAYFLQLKYISGSNDTVWKYTNTASTGKFGPQVSSMIYGQFKLKGYTCDGCREKYAFDPATPSNTLKIGSVPQTQQGGNSIYLTSGTSRTMLAQEFRPSETGTLTTAFLKLQVEGAGIAKTASYATVWITKHAKYGEYVCTAHGGLQTLAVCDTSFNGYYNQTCALGAVCDPLLGLNGGCGDRGKCELAPTVDHAHRLRPDGGGAAGPCGTWSSCEATMSLSPDHQKSLNSPQSAAWKAFEFKTPVPVEKHTTYFLNAAVVGNTDVSKEIIWLSGKAWGDGGVNTRASNALAGGDTNLPSDELRASFIRQSNNMRWAKNSNTVLATKFQRCVTSAATVMDFVTSGEKTGCCSARSSPQGGDKGASITVTGRNLFPSEHLKCIFRNENGLGGVTTMATVTDASYTKATCKAPTHSPHTSLHDCTNPSNCNGVELVMSSDSYTVGSQFMGPKWVANVPANPIASSAVPAYLGLNPKKFLFSDIHVSTGSGSDTVGDGSHARPYQTIQRGVDAANENDQIILHAGTYSDLGNRGLRHHGKRIQLRSYNADLQNTIIDCQHAPDGFILNNNKDSDSPTAGWIDTKDIITRNCENLRIYDI